MIFSKNQTIVKISSFSLEKDADNCISKNPGAWKLSYSESGPYSSYGWDVFRWETEDELKVRLKREKAAKNKSKKIREKNKELIDNLIKFQKE